MKDDLFVLVDDDGNPVGVVDGAQLGRDATKFAFELASVAGDDAAMQAVAERWAGHAGTPRAYGYLCAAALASMGKSVLPALLDIAEVAGVSEMRAKLAEVAHADEEGGGE